MKPLFHKKTAMSPLAESWELCAHPAGTSVVASGPYEGMPLPELVARNPSAMLGTACADGTLPVMIKLIDAKLALSIQVHPDNEYAMRVEHEAGKTEMWYIVDALPGSFLYFGLKEDCTQEQFSAAIRDSSVTALLNQVPVQAGDVFFIPAGTVHAIGAGILLAEIQQNSNTTYRVFDFDRVDKNGAKRELHIQKAADVAMLHRTTPQADACPIIKKTAEAQVKELPSCRYFQTFLLDIQAALERPALPSSFRHLLCLDGSGEFSANGEAFPIQKGDSLFVPAALGGYRLTGTLSLLETSIPTM